MATDPLSSIQARLTQMEAILEGMVPLLEQIVKRLDGPAPLVQGSGGATEMTRMATYADLYPQTEAGPPEGDLVAGRMGKRTSAPGWWAQVCGVLEGRVRCWAGGPRCPLP